MYAEVLVNLSARSVDRIFHYLVPEEFEDQVAAGSRVQVAFRQQKLEGYVVGFSQPPELNKIKKITAVLDRGPVFDSCQLTLARWMASYYLCPAVSALQAIIWPRLAAVPRTVQGLWLSSPANPGPDLSRTPGQAAAWKAASTQPGLTRQELAATAHVSVGTVDAILAKGLLYTRERKVCRNPLAGENPSVITPPVLTTQQAAVYREINDALQEGKHKYFLLHGVTGSGKTEVYCRSVASALGLNRQAVILVPEIALTPFLIETFYSRFGQQVAILHSRLSAGERHDEWIRVQDGKAKVILGTRSALFAPLKNPGLIVIDEEHEPSYKQEEAPRYHTRTVALQIAKEKGAVVVLGSATPSLESYYAALSTGSYRLLQMNERVEYRPLPYVQVVDMRQELHKGNPGLFSRTLSLAIQNRLAKHEQIILFLNRRGFSTFVVCRECGLVMKCPHCDISLTYHINGRLICHYCNYSVPAPALCPGCRSRYIGYFGAGTQKIEQEVQRLFAGARVLRMDSDTTTRKDSHRQILQAFRRGKADILIGTQMVAKGLDIPSVTLVGVVNADTTLYMPDFRASERTFQLLTQVAGRAGRGELGGEVLIQTYTPEHYAITAAKKHDYEGFFQQEIKNRGLLNYPPFTRLCRFLVTGTYQVEVENAADALRDILNEKIKNAGFDDQIQLMGAAPAPLARIKNRYRWHLALKAAGIEQLQEIALAGLSEFDRRFSSGRIRVAVDVEPQNMM